MIILFKLRSVISDNPFYSFLNCSRLNLEIENVNRYNDDERTIKSDRVMFRDDKKTQGKAANITPRTECIDPPCPPNAPDTTTEYVNENGTFLTYYSLNVASENVFS